MSWSGKATTAPGAIEDLTTVTETVDGWTRVISSYQMWTGKNWRECDGSRVFRLSHLRLARVLKDRFGGSWLWVNLPDMRGYLETYTPKSESLGIEDHEVLG